MIYTGNFSSIKQYGIRRLVSIARFPPKWARVESCMELAPYPKMLKMGPAEYIQEYKKILIRLDPQDIQAKYEGAVLLCYEKYDESIEKTIQNESIQDIILEVTKYPDLFCHRHLVSRWLNHAGIKCQELVKEKDVSKVQFDLF